MYINDIPISDYKAEITSRNITLANLVTDVEFIRFALQPLYSNQSYGFKKIEIGLEMRAENATELEVLKSKLSNDLKRAKITFKDIDYVYDGHLISIASAPITTKWEDVTISFEAVCTKKQKTIRLASVLTQSIVVEGNLETPCIYEIKPTTAIINFKINNILVRNLAINSTLLINGEDGTILLNGSNKMSDTELEEFPTLKPGVNTITINNTNCEINIKYKPRFV